MALLLSGTPIFKMLINILNTINIPINPDIYPDNLYLLKILIPIISEHPEFWTYYLDAINYSDGRVHGEFSNPV